MALYSSLSNSYTSAFPALNSIPTFFQSRKRSGSYNQPPCQHRHLLVPPKYPKYLKNTMFADLVQAQYEAINKRPKENSINNMEIHKDLLNWYDLDLRLPTSWNSDDKAMHIDVIGDGLELKYSGDHGRTEGHAGSARGNFPMKSQCGIFYFETEILSKGEDGYIGIGFFTKTNNLDRLPGWDTDSFGYHGDDGHSFGESGTGSHYGPCFTTNDIIGCGINFDNKTAFYTKNGSFLGIAFSNIDISKSYYPAVGLRTPGEHVKTNFGNEAFVFDLDSYIKSKKYSLKKEILQNENKLLNKSISQPMTESKDIVNLILTHLTHYGYVGTAKSLYKECKDTLGNETSLENMLDNVETDQRQNIRQSIMNGNIDKAISLTNKYYPGLLQENELGMDMIFELECGKFIEIMRSYMEYKSSLEFEENSHDIDIDMENSYINDFNSENNNHSFNHINKTETSNMDIDIDLAKINSNYTNSDDHHSHKTQALKTYTASENNFQYLQNQNQNNKNKNNKSLKRLSWASIAASSIEPSEFQEKIKPNKSNSCTTHSSSSASPTVISLHDTEMYEPTQLNPNNDDNQKCIIEEKEKVEVEKEPSYSTDDVGARILTSAMNLGQQLQSRCRSDSRLHINQRLTDIFSLFAYSKIENSPAAHLLDISGRDKLATKLNNFILEFRNENELSTLEKTYQQIIEVNKQLAYDGNGKAILLKMDSLDNTPCLTTSYDDN